MKQAEARVLAKKYSESLFRLLEGIFGDPQSALKFSRYTLQRLEGETDDTEEGVDSPIPLFRLARQTCQEYLSAGMFAKTLFALGDQGLPVSAIPALLTDAAAQAALPLEKRVSTLLTVLPGNAKLVLRLKLLEGLPDQATALLFSLSTGHLEQFLSRVGAVMGPGSSLDALTEPLREGLCKIPEIEVPPSLLRDGPASAAPAGSHQESPAPLRLAPRGTRLLPLQGGQSQERGYDANGKVPHPDWSPSFGFSRMTIAAVVVIAVGGFGAMLMDTSPRARADRVSAATLLARDAQQGRVQARPNRSSKSIGELHLPGAATETIDDGAPARASVQQTGHLVLDVGVEAWLMPGSVTRAFRDRLELTEGVMKVQVAGRAAGFMVVASPLRVRLEAGVYVFRVGGTEGAGLACIQGEAINESTRGKGMVAQSGHTIRVGIDGQLETRDLTPGNIGDGWGEQGAAVAAAASGGSWGGSGGETSGGSGESGAGGGNAPASSGGHRPLFVASSGATTPGALTAGGRVGSAGAFRGAGGYRPAF